MSVKRRAAGAGPTGAQGPAPPGADEGELLPQATPVDGGAADEADGTRPVLVGIGASAGGLDALTRLLRNVSSHRLAYVVVQHLAADQTERFLHTLSEQCRHPIVLVENGLEPQEGHVYLAPAHTLVELADGKFLLARRAEPPRPLLPIDYFLYSLANGPDGPGIGVVLSGMGTDGLAGLREVKAAGGIAIAQDPATAEYESMPRSAIEAGLADLVLAPEQIAAELPRLAERLSLRSLRPRHTGDALAVDDEGLGGIFDRLRAHSGVDFSSYKLGTIRRRLQRRMVLNKVDSLTRYLRLLTENPEEVKDLYQDLLINVTRFFREPPSFAALQELVFPKLLEDRRFDQPLRIWVPGCSTGEEAYSVAIALLEHLGERASSYQIQVFATDLSESAVGVARAGVYPQGISDQISPERLQRFFSSADGGYRMAKAVRDLCIFTRHDLTRDPPFSHLDLIMCRNVLIYLGAMLQKRVISVLHYGLKPDGFLVLGSAESIGSRGDLFRTVDKRHSIYGRKSAGQLPPPSFPRDYGSAGLGDPLRRPLLPPLGDHVRAQADRLLLERFAPPAVIVDANFNIVQTRGQTGHFLELAPGEANLNVLRMAREGLLYGLRTGLHQARQGDETVRKPGLRVRVEGGERLVALELVPIGSGPAETRHFLVLFLESAAAPPPPARSEASAPPPGSEGAAELSELREELADTRNYLQAMIQDLEAANEELQSANEEILSSNEELQSTNEELDTAREELQSTNEELHTLNEELQGRNEELGRVNSDLGNLLAGMQMAMVMVDNDLRIRRFTPTAERVLNMLPSDLGRPIGHLKPNLQCPELEGLIRQAIDDMAVVEQEVPDGEGGWYQLRIRSYKGPDNRIDGAVISLLDLTPIKQREREARGARQLANEMLAAIQEPLALVGLDQRVQVANDAFDAALRARPRSLAGRRLDELTGDGWDATALKQLFAKGRRAHRLRAVDLPLPGDGDRRLVARRLANKDGDEVVLLAIEPGAVEP